LHTITSGVVGDTRNRNWDLPIFQCLVHQLSNVLANHIWRVERLAPALQERLVEPFLLDWERKAEPWKIDGKS
jgi:hypothetical protein